MISKLVLIFFLSLLSGGCATIILDNEKLFSPGNPDPLVLPDPVCIDLKFKSGGIGAFNQNDPIEDMEPFVIREKTEALLYYNIILKCAHPAASFTVQYTYKTRNLWIKVPWAFVSVASAAVIPAYIKHEWTITLFENDQKLAEVDHQEKRLLSLFAFPISIMDHERSLKLYKTDAIRANQSRVLASLINAAIRKKRSNLNK